MNERVFRGLGVCGGIAFGRVHLVDRRRVSVPRYHIAEDKVVAELERFEVAIELSERQLNDIRVKAQKSQLKEVEMLLEAHAMVVRDQAIRDATRHRIEKDRLNAEWALKEEIREIRKMFDGLDQDYFKERRSDVDLVSDRVMRNLIGAETEFLENLSEDAIVVAYDLSPADSVALARYAARAFVTETGGKTSHTAIVAKAMNIPAVLGVHGIVEIAGFGDEIIIDGDAGEVILAPSGSVSVRYQKRKRRRDKEQDALRADRDLPATTTDGHRITLLGNIEVAEEIRAIKDYGGEGIGLYRTEFLVIERHAMPTATEHATEYSRVVRDMGGPEVTIRTIDIGGDKFVRTVAKPSEPPHGPVANPALGLRAIRLSLREPDHFKAQVRGILQASAVGSVRLLLPLITSVGELRSAKALIEEAKGELSAAGGKFDPQMPVGVMIETPAAVMLADLLAKECDFFSLGTNDLIQYSLAVDRANDDVAYLYRPCSPALLRMIDRTVRAAAEAAIPIPVTLCGEMAGDPFMLPLLIGLGLRRLSMSAPAIPLVKRLIRRVSVEACEALVASALDMATAEEVELEVGRVLSEWRARRSSIAAG